MHLRRQRSGLLSLRFARGWRQVLASLVVVLFALQSYVTQTHIHFLHLARAAQTVGLAVKAPAHHNPQPADNPASCPICQDMAMTGHYTAPGAILFALPPLVAMPAQAVLEVPRFVATVSHIWLGRAPPQH